VRTFRIAAIPGDGIGKEVIAAGVEVLDACAKRDGGFAVAFDHFDWGSERYKKTGAFMPDNGRDLIKATTPSCSARRRARRARPHHAVGPALAICQPFDQYANVRPTRILPGITSPLRASPAPSSTG
jgi:tartrate dehydrogenase/decarboxylase/D-malate dehydrogenase